MPTPLGRFSWLVIVCGVGAASCAGAPPAAPPDPGPPRVGAAAPAPPRAPILEDEAPVAAASADPAPVDPAPEMGLREVSEREWLGEVRAKVAKRHDVAPEAIVVSPGRARAAFVREPATGARRRGPRRFVIVVTDLEGKRQQQLRPVTRPRSDEPPRELDFLGDDRLVYEVPPLPDPPAGAARVARVKPPAKSKVRTKAPAQGRRAPPRGKTVPPSRLATSEGPPPRLFVIQPLGKRARPLRCEGRSFVLHEGRQHLAYVKGDAPEAVLAVDGAPLYPRVRGARTTIAGAPAWSKDGQSLAFVEAPPDGAPRRLVLVVALDDASGDTTWDLPPAARADSLRVFWAGPRKIVVGKSLAQPSFAASFNVQR